MDYLALSTLSDTHVDDVVLTYDLACLHSKNFAKRVQAYPHHFRDIFSRFNFQFAVPKKHLPAHGPNHSHFSLNFLQWVGRTYGEGIESGWSHMNPISMSTREMAPATRHEVIDLHWSAWNHMKIIHFGTCILCFILLLLILQQTRICYHCFRRRLRCIQSSFRYC